MWDPRGQRARGPFQERPQAFLPRSQSGGPLRPWRGERGAVMEAPAPGGSPRVPCPHHIHLPEDRKRAPAPPCRWEAAGLRGLRSGGRSQGAHPGSARLGPPPGMRCSHLKPARSHDPSVGCRDSREPPRPPGGLRGQSHARRDAETALPPPLAPLVGVRLSFPRSRGAWGHDRRRGTAAKPPSAGARERVERFAAAVK